MLTSPFQCEAKAAVSEWVGWGAVEWVFRYVRSLRLKYVSFGVFVKLKTDLQL